MYNWDETKRLSNLDKHGVDFHAILDFDWHTALIASDPRHSENRYIGLGMLAGRLHAVVFTYRQDTVRLISLRKANKREQKRYDHDE